MSESTAVVFAVCIVLAHDALATVFLISKRAVLAGRTVVAGPAAGETLCAADDDGVPFLFLGLRYRALQVCARHIELLGDDAGLFILR
jgi:hypothetical protein